MGMTNMHAMKDLVLRGQNWAASSRRHMAEEVYKDSDRNVALYSIGQLLHDPEATPNKSLFFYILQEDVRLIFFFLGDLFDMFELGGDFKTSEKVEKGEGANLIPLTKNKRKVCYFSYFRFYFKLTFISCRTYYHSCQFPLCVNFKHAMKIPTLSLHLNIDNIRRHTRARREHGSASSVWRPTLPILF
jgi:hypothetical protein